MSANIGNKLVLIFSSIPEYSLYTKVYESIWNSYGKSIVDAFQTLSHINFTEELIYGTVGDGDKDGNNYAGAHTSAPMLFRYNVRDKLGTVFHELGHRLIMEHDYFEKSRNILGIKDDHQLLDLFLYDVIELVFGERSAKGRVEYEISFPEKKYRESWEWVLEMGKAERQNILKKLALQLT